MPWIAVPSEVISDTFPARTCSRKNGEYGTRTRDSPSIARDPAQKLIASKPTRIASHQPKRGRRGDREPLGSRP